MKTAHEYALKTSLFLRDTWPRLPATQARSMAEQMRQPAVDLASFQADPDETMFAIAHALIGEENKKVFAGFVEVMKALGE